MAYGARGRLSSSDTLIRSTTCHQLLGGPSLHAYHGKPTQCLSSKKMSSLLTRVSDTLCWHTNLSVCLSPLNTYGPAPDWGLIYVCSDNPIKNYRKQRQSCYHPWLPGKSCSISSPVSSLRLLSHVILIVCEQNLPHQ